MDAHLPHEDGGEPEGRDGGYFVSDSSIPVPDAGSDAGGELSGYSLVCEQLTSVEGCTVASKACEELEPVNPLSVRECGTSIADGKPSKEAADCVIEAANSKEPFVLSTSYGPLLEGEFSEIAWLGIAKESGFEVVVYITSGGGCCPALPRNLSRKVCSSIFVVDDSSPSCEEENDSSQEVCGCSDSLWFNQSPCSEYPR
jgi:hypothetical protein